MRSLQGVGLLLTLAMAAAASASPDPLPGVRYPDPSYGDEAERRGGGRRRKSEEDAEGGEAAYDAAPREDYYKVGWSTPNTGGDGDAGDGNDTPWATEVSASESELRGVISRERIRWMPSRSRFRPAKIDDVSSVDLSSQDRQRRQRKRRPGLRPGTHLENLGGGILVDEEGDAAPPSRKRPAQRRPHLGANNPTGGKLSPVTDLKSILKASGPLSLSEILQQKNLSLDELLRGGRNALSAITSTANEGAKSSQRRRPVSPTIGPRALLKRRRPMPTTTTPPVTPRSEQQTTTHATAIGNTDNSEMSTSTIAPQSSPVPPSTGDPSQDILEIIWQDGGNDGPSLADVLSSRNMTVADLIEQRERAAGRADITALFKEVEKEDGEEEVQKEGRQFAHFDLPEADWDEKLIKEKEQADDVASEVDDQLVTQSRNMYQVISSVERTEQPEVTETKVTHPYKSSLSEDPPFPEDHRPILRSRLSTPSFTAVRESKVLKEVNVPTAPNFNDADLDYRDEESESSRGLPMGVKSAIIASSGLLGIALLIFLSIFAAFRYRQWRRRGGLGPYFCVSVLEAASGSKNSKGPTIAKQGRRAKEGGWGDTIDSAQARLWKTLRRGRCRLYDRERGKM